MKMGGQGILSEYFFEGTEKLLEVWFECSREDDRADLRIIDRYDKGPLKQKVSRVREPVL